MLKRVLFGLFVIGGLEVLLNCNALPSSYVSGRMDSPMHLDISRFNNDLIIQLIREASEKQATINLPDYCEKKTSCLSAEAQVKYEELNSAFLEEFGPYVDDLNSGNKLSKEALKTLETFAEEVKNSYRCIYNETCWTYLDTELEKIRMKTNTDNSLASQKQKET